MNTLATATVLNPEQLRSFHEQGYLILREVIAPAEIDALRASMDALMANAAPGKLDNSFSAGHKDGQPVLRRIDYILDKSAPSRALLGHPVILSAVEQLAGPDFFTGQDAMVFKAADQGIAVPWHRDLASGDDYPTNPPVFIGDYYIDDANLNTCLWVIPGSHRWPAAQAHAVIQKLNAEDFSRDGAIPVEMRAGDVLFHSVRLLHGSPINESPQSRRVLYYTFHTAHIVAEHGPHRREYIDLKQKVLLACLRERAKTAYAKDEEPFVYRAPAPFDAVRLGEGEIETYRYVRGDYLR